MSLNANKEAMKQEDFVMIMELLNGAYKDFDLYENRMKTFYIFFKYSRPADLWIACMRYIKDSRFAPTIHDLLPYIEEIENEQHS